MRGGAHDFKGSLRQHRKARIAAVFQLELESAKASYAVDGRRIECEQLRLWNILKEAVVDAIDDRIDIIARRLCAAPKA